MKGSVRTLSSYVLQGFLITASLLGLKILAEHTSFGRRVELLTFESVQSALASLGPSEELPVVVLDTSRLQAKDGQLVDLAQLREIIAAVAEQRPRAIAIDLVLNPADITDAGRDGSDGPTAQQAQEYYEFLDFCLDLKEKRGVPIFIGVGMTSAGAPREWLGQEKYQELAATALIQNENPAYMPVWVRAGPDAGKLYSLGASLARAYAAPRLSDRMSWAIETTDEGLPGTRRYLEGGVEYVDAPVNFGKLDALRQSRLFTLSGASVKESGERFRSKMVLLGDATLYKTMAVYTLPGESEPVPAVYMHACAAYTFAREPLYEIDPTVRLFADDCLSLLIFGVVGLTRYRHVADGSRAPAVRHRAALVRVAVLVVIVAAVVIFYSLGLLWLDLLLVALAVLLQPAFAKMFGQLFARGLVHDPGAAVASPVHGEGQAKNRPRAIQQAGRKPRRKARRTMKTRKRKILFIAANPSDASRIQTDREHRIIKAEIGRGSRRDAFEFLQPQFAVTITELLRAMNAGPNIVHFSGHGETAGIVITKDDNQSQLLTAEVLERLFRPLRDVTELVVLNSCYSASQAASISSLGMYVIGNNLPVGDGAAISFAKGLYNGLSEGKSFEAAVNDARIVVMAEAPDFSAVVEVWADGNKLDA
jgi:CHASE2 domain-containing sensor protein